MNLCHHEICKTAQALGVSKTPARLFLLLWHNRGRIVPTTFLMDNLLEGPADFASWQSISSAVARLRKALKKATVPVEIKTAHRLGFQLVLLDEAWTYEA